MGNIRMHIVRNNFRTSELKNVSINSKCDKSSCHWELDLCSRPILDERGKKLWELVITDANKSFVFSRFFSGNNINSSSIGNALKEVIETPGATRPLDCLFFRSQIQNIITRALSTVSIKAIPSRRCFGLINLLRERQVTTLQESPGFYFGGVYPTAFEAPTTSKLPDALRGDQWAFVQLSFFELQDEIAKIVEGEIFGSTPNLQCISKSCSSETIIPGVVVCSPRAFPLAAWTNSHELAAVSTDFDRNCLVIDFGINQRWCYGSYRPSEAAIKEAEAWEKTKSNADGLHFLAIQSEFESNQVEGLWIMWAPTSNEDPLVMN